MFASAIQNLSQMAIQESGLTLPQTASDSIIEELKAQLDAMTPLTENEARVDPTMVTIKASNRLYKYLIEANELSDFMITNGITDAREAIGYILEAQDLVGEYHNVAIVIDEGSILDEMDNLGYAVSDFNLQTPPKGLGLAMVGKQKDFAKLRNIANTKELMDLLTGRYGLPLVKRNYKSLGLLNDTKAVQEASPAEEDVQLRPEKGAKVIHENPKSRKKKLSEESDDYNEASVEEQPGDEDQMQEGWLGDKFASFKSKASNFKQNAGSFIRNHKDTIAKGAVVGGIGGLGLLAAKDRFKPKYKETVVTKEIQKNQIPEWALKGMGESSSMISHEAHIQYLKDVAAGKYNDEDWA